MSPLEYTVKRLLEYTVKRLFAFLDEINRLSTSEFPYPQSKEALQILEQMFQDDLSHLNQLDPSSDIEVVKQKCKLILERMADYLPLLGFILRSTNVRNAFEVFGPILRLAGAILEPHLGVEKRRTRVILSSEWDYSPYVYREIPALPGFALIGLPAPESSNPFLIPLYGHELGHLVWIKNKIGTEMRPQLIKNIVGIIRTRWSDYQKVFPHYEEIKPEEIENNLFAIDDWTPASQWALRQAEESFCDFVGLCVFGPSFLHAFAYLVSPSLSRVRSVNYPNTKVRVTNLLRAAEYFKINKPSGYKSLFEDSNYPTMTEADRFRLSVADAALEAVVVNLIDRVKIIVDSSSLEKPSKDEEDRIYERLRKVVPGENCRTLPDILNAAWRAYEDPGLWEHIPQIREKKDSVLKNVVLKNIEVFEIEQILR